VNAEQILKLLEPYKPTFIECVRGGWEELLQGVLPETRLKFTLSARANVIHSLTTSRLKVAFVENANALYIEQGLLRIVQVSGGDGAVLVRAKKLDEDLRTSNVLDWQQQVMGFAEPVRAVVNLGYTVKELELKYYLNEIYLQQENKEGKLWVKSIWRADLEESNAAEVVTPTPPAATVVPRKSAIQDQGKASS